MRRHSVCILMGMVVFFAVGLAIIKLSGKRQSSKTASLEIRLLL